jgi:hypothetical protein
MRRYGSKRSLIVWWFDLQLLVLSVPITTKVYVLTLACSEMHSLDTVCQIFADDGW